MLWVSNMRLSNKVIITLGIVWIIFLAISYLGAQKFLISGFLKLETDQVNKNIIRVHQAIDQISYALGTFTSDWAHWNDAYDFILGKNPQFVPNNIDINALVNSNINLLMYLDKKGAILLGLSVDLKKKKQIAYPKGLEKYIYPGSFLETHQNPITNIRGLIALDQGIMLIAAAGISSTDLTKPLDGVLITGRAFSLDLLKTIAKNTSLELNLYEKKQIRQSSVLKQAYENALQSPAENNIAILNDKILYGYILLKDVEKNPIGLIRLTIPRSVYLTGIETINYYLAGYLILGIIFALVIGFLLRVVILKRLASLTTQIHDIVKSKNYSRRIPLSHNDELTLVAKEFNKLMQTIQNSYEQLEKQVLELSRSEYRLEKTNKHLYTEIAERKDAEAKIAALNSKLILAARRAGMADIVNGILHNIGNILNSVITSVAITQERTEQSHAAKMMNLIQLINNQKNNLENFLKNNDKNLKILEYIMILGKSWAEENSALLNELNELNKNISHIKNVITMQQSLGKIIGITEEVELDKLIEDVLLLNKLSYEDSHIKIISDFKFSEKIIIDRVKLLHVVANLIKNSIDSLAKSGKKHKEIIIRIQESQNEYFTIQILDNGIGIASENLTKIFAYGFTTKKGGYGYGLHASATFVQEMHGKLYAESEGIGKGATLTLVLPKKPKLPDPKNTIVDDPIFEEWKI